ncbi:MAG: DNA methyltransferase, partial [Bacteroidia bacterium]
MNQLILGDNLEVLRNMNSESVDLIYIDPPFFSNRTYEVIWGDKGEVRSFEDRFSGGIDHYIAWLKERVMELHRILKPTGSIFVHCDWHADSYIRAFVLDKIFGNNNFRNKITWKRSDTHNDAKKQMPNVCDDIFFYSKSDNYVFNVQYGKHADKTLKEWYQYLEFKDGTIRKMTKEENFMQIIPKDARRFNTDNMASPNPRPNLMYEYKGYSYPDKGWRYSLETMQKLDTENRLFFPKEKTGRIMLKRYLDEQKGAVIGDFWDDIDQIRAAHKERIGYPTQKPEKLLERIIQMASN